MMTLTTGITDFAFRVCEAPLTARQRIFEAGNQLKKVLLAIFILPFVYCFAWLMILVCAALSPARLRYEDEIVVLFRSKLHDAAPKTLQDIVKAIQAKLPRLEKLQSADKSLRQLSPTYTWLLAGFDDKLENVVADYEDILEAIHIGTDPEVRRRLLDSIREETPQHVA